MDQPTQPRPDQPQNEDWGQPTNQPIFTPTQPRYAPAPPTRPQPVYAPPPVPQPMYPPPPVQAQQPMYPPPPVQAQQPRRRNNKLLAIGGIAVAAIVIIIIIAATSGGSSGSSNADQGQYIPGTPAAIVQGDGYSVVNGGSGTLNSGVPVRWAEGSNASNVGILVVTSDNTADAATAAAGLQATSTAVTVTQNGDTVTLLDPNGAGDISSWLSNNGWTN